MTDRLLAYLMDDLDDEQRTAVERRLACDPVWQRELQRLETCIGLPFQESPPEDLVNRTCSLVREKTTEQNRHARSAEMIMPPSLTESREGLIGSPSRWSWTDGTVGAGILVVLAMLVFPALCESRETARRLACQNNMLGLGEALAAFVEHSNGQLPQISREENAGMFVVRLAESGVIDRESLAQLLVCPSTPLAEDVFRGNVVMRVPTSEALQRASPEELEWLRHVMAGSFAYRIGHIDKQGNYRHVKFRSSAHLPMLADAPSFDVAGFQSANHGGCGQNVLFQDLSVRYGNQCAEQDARDHLFLNHDQQHQAGRSPTDTVLIRSEYGPCGPLTGCSR